MSVNLVITHVHNSLVKSNMIKKSLISVDFKGLSYGVHGKRGLYICSRTNQGLSIELPKKRAVVSQLLPKLKESVPPSPRLIETWPCRKPDCSLTLKV